MKTNFYCLYKANEKRIVNKSNTDEFETRFAESNSDDFQSEKIHFILNAINESWGSYFLYADAGFTVFDKFLGELKFQIQDKDIASITSDSTHLSLSFMYIKANPQTRALFLKLLSARESTNVFNAYFKEYGDIGLLNLIKTNYCKIKSLDNKFFELSSHKLKTNYDGKINKRKPSFINNILVYSNPCKKSKPEQRREDIEQFKEFYQHKKEKPFGVSQASIDSLNLISVQTLDLARKTAELSNTLKLHTELLRIKSDQMAIMSDEEDQNLKENICIAVNHPEHLNSTRFNLAKESRNSIEILSSKKITFKNVIPEKNCSNVGIEGDKPFIIDLIQDIYESCESEWIGYTNADIIFKPSFCKYIAACSKKYYGSICCMADGVINEKDLSLNQILSLSADVRSRGGRDVFIIRRSLWPQVKSQLPNYIIGEPEWDIAMFSILEKQEVTTFDLFNPCVVRQEVHPANWSTESKAAKYNSNLSKQYGIDINSTFKSLQARPLLS